MKAAFPPIRRRLRIACGFVLPPFLLAACTVGPRYESPRPTATGSGWTESTDTSIDLSAWWRSFGDPTLDRLVETALARNIDVRQAQASIAEARALRDKATGASKPSVDVNASVTQRRQSENGALPIRSIPGYERDQTIHDIGFDASWELDLFGRVRRSVEASEARFQAEESDARAVRISVAAEVARNYLAMRGAQRELAAQSATVETRRRTLELVRLRINAGDLSAAELDSVQAELDRESATVPTIRARLRSAALGLGILLGELPEKELGLLESPPPDITLKMIPVGTRADLLRRRPDVRAAERRLAASTAQTGLAQAEWFPKLSIGASGGFEALDAGDLLKSSSQALSIAPLISWRIFDGGRVRAEIRAAEARQENAALAYEKTVLSALSDAERALNDYRFGLEALRTRRAAVTSAQRAYENSKIRFERGDTRLTELLDAERRWREAEYASASIQTSTATELVTLFKTLGGGVETQDTNVVDSR